MPRDLSSLLPFHLAFSDTWWIVDLDGSDNCDLGILDMVDLDGLDDCGLRMQYFLIT